MQGSDPEEPRVISFFPRLSGAVRAGLAERVLDTRFIPPALAVVTFAVFSPGLWNGFVEWDDYVNLFNNQNYRGLHWPQVRWMFTSTLMGHYIPLTWLSFGIDYTLWGMNPFGYHLTNTLMHAANAALFYLVALRLLGKATSLTGSTLRLAGAVATLFFALHPLRAESVAWATERRDVLSGLFFLLAVLAYLTAAEAERGRRRWLLAGSIGSYLLALASKSIVMTLPLVLVLLDVYPLGRLQWSWRPWASPSARAVLKEKLPYFALGLAGAITSYWAVAAHDYLTSFQKYPGSARLGMTAYSLWFYFEKTMVPIWLSLLYELPVTVNPLEPRFLLSAIGVIVMSGFVLALCRRWPAGLAVWMYYGIVLGPVTGIVHAGHQLTHDRYSYLSCLGWALLVGAAVGAVARGGAMGRVQPWLTRAAAAVAAVWIVALATLTWYQVQVWRDTETLWRYGADSDPACSICQSNLGDVFLRQRLSGLAKEKFELALRLRPDRVIIHSNLGTALCNLGDCEAGIRQVGIALAKSPNDPGILNNMAGALINQKRYAEAIGHLERARGVDPNQPAVLANLGLALTETGRPEAGLGYLLRAVEINPDEPMARLNLARAYLALGRPDGAREQYEALRKLDARLAKILEPALSSVR